MKEELYSKGPEAIGQLVASSKVTGSKATSDKDDLGFEGVKALFASEADSLIKIEQEIRSHLGADLSLLTEISEYLLQLGGKRIRPLLCCFSSRLFGQPVASKEIISASAGIEIIHMATLLHDDIIDRSLVRRHSESAFSKFGQTPTLLTGDFLLVRAFGICSRLGSFVAGNTEKACVELTEGELMEGHLGAGREVSLEDYITIGSKKTASLFGLATAIAAHYCASDRGDIEKLRKFGIHTGILFQMVDDILDIAADRSMLGKPGGIDLRQKVPTLVNVLWTQLEPEKATEFFAQAEYSDSQIEETRQYLMKSEVIDQAMQQIKIQHQTAKDLLDNLGSPEVDPTIKAKLVELLDYTVNRIPENPA